MCPGKITVLPVRPFVLFLPGLVTRICPDLPISAAVCLRVVGQKLAQMLSVYTKKIAGGQGSTTDPAEELTTLSQAPKSDPRPRRLSPVALAPYDSRLRRPSRTSVPKLWSP